MDFHNSRTYQNLQTAFHGEAIANTKYTLYGIKAREEGFEQLGNIFDATAKNEREHARMWLRLLEGGELPVTLSNLRDSYHNEKREWTSTYRDYAATARSEGYHEIAALFDGVAEIERYHDNRFRRLEWNIINEQMFCKDDQVYWQCLKCGNVIYGMCAPKVCPVCGNHQGFYQTEYQNY
ncbi:MAG: rubrerythrin family protein [Herbinix sp.]|jgi:rubrerythrin|nr:rubrerythrin family protein [Herbinix sp.]